MVCHLTVLMSDSLLNNTIILIVCKSHFMVWKLTQLICHKDKYDSVGD